MAEAGAPKGNRNAAKGRKFREALNKALANGGKSRLPNIAQALVDAAEAGESWAIKEVADRLDGKPAQELEMSGYITDKEPEITKEEADKINQALNESY